MIDPKSTQSRTRRYTMPEILRAIGHAMSRPGHRLVSPVVRQLPKTVSAQTPAAELELPDSELAALIAWSRVMASVQSIVLLPYIQPARLVCIRVTGTLAEDGPVVVVLVHLDANDLPVEIEGRAVRRVRALLPHELYALGDAVAQASADTLVGV